MILFTIKDIMRREYVWHLQECNLKLLLYGHHGTFNGSQPKRCPHTEDFPSFTVSEYVLHLKKHDSIITLPINSLKQYCVCVTYTPVLQHCCRHHQTPGAQGNRWHLQQGPLRSTCHPKTPGWWLTLQHL